MNRRIKQIALVFAMGAQAVMYQNCSDARFTDAGQSINESVGAVEPLDTNPPQCRTDLMESTRTVKILLLVDTSGSNVQKDGKATDPVKKWRLAAIKSLVDKYGGKSNIHFSLVTFSSVTASLINGPSGAAEFSNSQKQIQNGVTAFTNFKDAGGTHYKTALAKAKDIVQRDIATSLDRDAVYSIIMVSDGKPEDYEDEIEVVPDVAAITSLAEGRVNVNSVFYYNTKQQALKTDTAYLKNIATIGKGMFVTANADQSVNLNDTIKVPQEVCN